MKHDIKKFLEENKYQAYLIDMLTALYQKYCADKNIGDSINLDNLFKVLDYPIENALLNKYGGTLVDNNNVFQSIEDITCNKKLYKKNENKIFNGIAISFEAYEAVKDYYDGKTTNKLNELIHWEHITPKSVCYRKLKEVFNIKFSKNKFKEELIKNVLNKNKIIILSKEESALLDKKPENWKQAYKTKWEELSKEMQELRRYMSKKSEALTRLYFMSLIDDSIKISFDGCDTFYTISNLINVVNEKKISTIISTIKDDEEIKKEWYLSDSYLGIEPKELLKSYFDNYKYNP